METGETEGFDSAASVLWKMQRTAVFFSRKTSFPTIPWCLGRGGTASTGLLGKSSPWIQGAEPGACTEPLVSFPLWMDVEVKEDCNSLGRRGLGNA